MRAIAVVLAAILVLTAGFYAGGGYCGDKGKLQVLWHDNANVSNDSSVYYTSCDTLTDGDTVSVNLTGGGASGGMFPYNADGCGKEYIGWGATVLEILTMDSLVFNVYGTNFTSIARTATTGWELIRADTVLNQASFDTLFTIYSKADSCHGAFLHYKFDIFQLAGAGATDKGSVRPFLEYINDDD